MHLATQCQFTLRGCQRGLVEKRLDLILYLVRLFSFYTDYLCEEIFAILRIVNSTETSGFIMIVRKHICIVISFGGRPIKG